MTDDTAALFRQEIAIDRAHSKALGTAQGEAVWKRCLQATKRLHRASPAFQAEFALLLAQGQYRIYPKPPRQMDLWPAVRLAGRYVWYLLPQLSSRHFSLLDTLRASWLSVRYWTGHAWPGHLYTCSLQSAAAESFATAVRATVQRRHAATRPLPAWAKYVLGGVGISAVLFGLRGRREAA